jgi:competence protein ComEA
MLPAADTSSGMSTSPSAGTPSPTGTVTVDVVGRVRRPGVVRLPAGSRVADAMAAAGGASSGADPSAVNLAALLVDGQQVRIPRVGDPPVGQAAGSTGVGGTGAAADGGAGSGGGGAGGGGSGSGVTVNLNTASVSELDGLPGVGPVLAQRIVDWRTQHGRFASVDQLGEVSGIGDKIMAQLRPRVTV